MYVQQKYIIKIESEGHKKTEYNQIHTQNIFENLQKSIRKAKIFPQKMNKGYEQIIIVRGIDLTKCLGIWKIKIQQKKAPFLIIKLSRTLK